MFQKLLIANRGEIACRIIRTAKQLGITTVAVYSDADKTAQHVMLADEAYPIGPAPSRDSYLNIDKIIEIAKQSGAHAIHPGYGFLSEDADFATRCQAEQIIFVGPPAAAMAAMGDKRAAKQHMQQHHIPTVPGYEEADQTLHTLLKAAETIGFPLLIKAAAGGGGKGMRRVNQLTDFEAALESAQYEAQASFGDNTVLLEKYVMPARHVEVQVFADQQGHCVYLFDRDCSTQRRHQKVLEEAPAPHLSQKTKTAMGQAAVNAALAIGYLGAGTVEFLVDAEEHFYFMEMNTRLQVEHPVTELITHLDLVEWQLRVASGEPLPCTQADLTPHGHAIEVRLCAEDPAKNFAPSIGRLQQVSFPTTIPHIRVDTGFRTGDTISQYYDSLLAKIIAWGETRELALATLRSALQQTEIIGIHTNLSLLARLTTHPVVTRARIVTQFLEEALPTLLADTLPMPWILIATTWSLWQQVRTTHDASPWHVHDGFRLYEPPSLTQFWVYQQHTHRVRLTQQSDHWQAEVDQDPLCTFAVRSTTGDTTLIFANGTVTYHAKCLQGTWSLFHQGDTYTIQPAETAIERTPNVAGDGLLQAPMPGTITRVRVAVGDHVEAGTLLITLEAMKMEHRLLAQQPGIVTHLYVKEGDTVTEGMSMLNIEVCT